MASYNNKSLSEHLREYCKAMREAGEAWKEAFRANALRNHGKEKTDLLHFVVEGTINCNRLILCLQELKMDPND